MYHCSFARYINNKKRGCVQYLDSTGIEIVTLGTIESALFDLAIIAYDNLILNWGIKRKNLDRAIKKWKYAGLSESDIYLKLIKIFKAINATKKYSPIKPEIAFDWEDPTKIYYSKLIYKGNRNQNNGRKKRVNRTESA